MTALSVLVGLCLLAQGTVADQLATKYAAWDAAYLRRDVVALARMLHPRFRVVSESGKVTARDAYVRHLWRSDPPARYETALLRAHRSGQRATAYTRETSQPRDGESHVHLYRDTWMLVSGRWTLLESLTLEER